MNKISTTALGVLGESYAEKFLVSQGYEIITKNYHSRYGEIDLIAVEPPATLVFIEVKARKSAQFGEPEDAVDFYKQQKLLKTALYFLKDAITKFPQIRVRPWRFDLIAIKLNHENFPVDIVHYKNIFDG